MTFPLLAHPQGAPEYPYAGGPIGPRPKVIDLAVERRKKLEKVSLEVQLVYWSIAVVMICAMVVVVFAFTPLDRFIPLVPVIGSISGLVLSLVEYIFCASAPQESIAQPYVIAVLCSVGLGFLTQFAAIGLAALEFRSGANPRQGMGVATLMGLV